MKNLFKKETRYSQTKRPRINSTVIFSPVKELINDFFIQIKNTVDFLIAPKTLCKVLRNNRYTVTVLIDNKSYIVSPIFLINNTLTLEGKKILGKLKEKSKKLITSN